MELFREIQRKFKITDPVTLKDIMSFPDVISKPMAPHMGEEAISELKDVVFDELSTLIEDL